MPLLPPLNNDEGSAGVLAYFGSSCRPAVYMPRPCPTFRSAPTPACSPSPPSQRRINSQPHQLARRATRRHLLPNAYYAIITSLRQEGAVSDGRNGRYPPSSGRSSPASTPSRPRRDRRLHRPFWDWLAVWLGQPDNPSSRSSCRSSNGCG